MATRILVTLAAALMVSLDYKPLAVVVAKPVVAAHGKAAL